MIADTVRVERVAGEILYGAGNQTPTVPVKAGETLAAGTFSAAANGILYLSVFSGSELRLAESGTLRFEGVKESRPVGHRSTFQLLQGKLLVTIRHPETSSRGFLIRVTRGAAAVESGQCVLCHHSEGTYVYVARGVTRLTGTNQSARATPHPSGGETASITPVWRAQVVVQKPIVLTGNGNIGLLENNGTIHVRSLSTVSPSTQACLLEGLQTDAVGGSSHDLIDPNRPIVSPIQ